MKWNKKVFFTTAAVVVIFITVSIIQKKCMPPLYKKLQGAYNINLEQSNISRYVDFRPLGSNVFFNNTHIELPIILTTKENVKGTYDDIKRLENNAKGKWRIIHNNPDSIFIEVPKSILNGKYAVIFKKETHLYQTSYHLILKNDSTYIECTKVLHSALIEDWE